MAHDGVMNAPGADWERLDAPAHTPSGAARGSSPGRRSSGPTFRLRRSRGPVLAALDGGATIFQRRLRDIMIGATVILVPAVALNVWVTVLGFDRLDPSNSPVPGFLTDDSGRGIEDVAVWMAAVFASFVAAVVGYLAAVILLGERFGRPVSLGSGLRRTARRLPAIFVAWSITHWWFPLMVLITVTASADATGWWIFLFVFLCWFAAAATLLVIPTMVGEDLGPFAAARRSWRLTRLRFGVCLVFVLLSTFVALLLGSGIAALVPLLETTGFVTLGDATAVVQGVMVQLAVLVVVPLMALATAQAYVEVRVVGEGLDLTIDADTAFGPRPEQPAPAGFA